MVEREYVDDAGVDAPDDREEEKAKKVLVISVSDTVIDPSWNTET